MAEAKSSEPGSDRPRGPVDRAVVLDSLLNTAFKPGEGWRKDGRPLGWALDCRDMLLSARVLPATCRLLCDAVAEWRPDFVAATGLSGAPLVAGMISESHHRAAAFDGLLIRDRPKEYGLRRQVEGPRLPHGGRVVIVDDLVNAGDTAVFVATVLSREGFSVVGVATLVEFDTAGSTRLAGLGLPSKSLFSLVDLGISASDASKRSRWIATWRFGGINSAGDDVPSSRPILCDRAVIVGSNRGFVAAIEPGGAPKWQRAIGSSHPPAAVHGSPLSTREGILIGADNGLLACLSPDTGASRWETRCGDRVGSTAVSDDGGRIFIGATELPTKGALVCLSPSDGRVLWRAPLSGYAHAAPALSADRRLVVAADNSGALRCFRTNDGAPLWTVPVGAAIKADLAVDTAGRCFCCGFDGHLTAVDIVSGAPIWRRRLGRRLYSVPASTPAGLVVGAEIHAFCLDPASGHLNWLAYLGAPVRGRMARLGDGTLAFGCTNGAVQFVSVAGAPEGTFRTGGPVTSGVATLDDETALVSSSDGYLYAIRQCPRQGRSGPV